MARPESQGKGEGFSHALNDEIYMKISPEPLCPLRSWRELWQPESYYEHTLQPSAPLPITPWKEQKRSGFHWLSHLFSRNADR
jgi:hypothetical protein